MAISDAQGVLPLAADSEVRRTVWAGEWIWWLRWTSSQLLLVTEKNP